MMLRRWHWFVSVVYCVSGFFAMCIASFYYSDTQDGSDMLRIVVKEGQQTDLPCITYSPPFNRTHNVRWVHWFHRSSRDPHPSEPFYKVEFGKSQSSDHSQVVRWSSDEWMSKAYFSLMSYPFSLKLVGVRFENAGTFVCSVKFNDESVRNGTINLQVIVMPEPPVITDIADQPLPSVAGPFNETSRLVLQCKVKGGKPQPTVTWFRNSIPVSGNHARIRVMRSDDVTISQLTLMALQRDDDEATYTCVVSNMAAQDNVPLSAEIRLELNLSPLVVQIRRIESSPMSSGINASIVCEVWGCKPRPHVTWWKNDNQLRQTFTHTSMDGNLTTSVLEFIPRAEDNGQTLVCRAENPRMATLGIREDQWMLSVHYKPNVNLRVDGGNHFHTTVEEGKSLQLTCFVEANPPPERLLIWTHNGERIKHNHNHFTIRNNKLLIRNVQYQHDGNYTCDASNKEGSSTSNVQHIIVNHAPICKPNQRVLYTAPRSRILEVHCDVIAQPKVTSFLWKFNDTRQTRQFGTSEKQWSGSRSVLRFAPRDADDFGVLLCYGKNAVGQQREPCVFIITPDDSAVSWLSEELLISLILCGIFLLLMLLIVYGVIKRRRNLEAGDSLHCGIGKNSGTINNNRSHSYIQA